MNDRTVTIQVTDDCCCACTYCYQINKGHHYMTKETAKKVVDTLFNLYEENNPEAPINKEVKKLYIELIGGEPLMNIDVMDYITSYFIERCINENHPWLGNVLFSIPSNGVKYFDPKVQQYFTKFKDLISYGISIDGPEEIHDACRVYPNGEGCFKDAFAAFTDLKKQGYHQKTKVTISPENLENIHKTFIFFFEQGVVQCFGSVANEPEWTIEEGKRFYEELKIAADYIIDNDLWIDILSFFNRSYGQPIPESEQGCWCGSSKWMMAFNTEGTIYPCLRFMESSLSDTRPPVIIGDIEHGVGYNQETKGWLDKLHAITRKTKYDDECYNCPIAFGCADCEAWNYQKSGKLGSKSKGTCNMVKGQVLANAYYWNKQYLKHGNKEIYKLNLPKEECLKFISEEEYNMLKELEKR